MKICYIADASSIHVTEWAKFFLNKGHEVSIISDINSPIDGIPIYYIGDCLGRHRIPIISAALQITRKVKAIKNILQKIKPDIVHAHYATNYGYLTAKSGFHPFFLTCHGSDILIDLKINISKYFVKYAIKKAVLITTPSKPMADIVKNLGIPEKKIHILQYGIDTIQFNNVIKKEKPVRIISTRNITPKYRLDVLVDAACSINKKYPDLIFDILGDGSEKMTLEKKVQVSGLANNTIFHGNINHTDIQKYYQNAHIYVTTSPTDGLSISLLEAMACGCYPVVPDNDSNRHVEELGFYLIRYNVNDSVELAIKVRTVLNDLPGLVEKLSSNRKLIERHFSKNAAFQKIQNIYDENIK